MNAFGQHAMKAREETIGRRKRRYARVGTDQAGVISFIGGKDQIACVIRDVSQGGAGLSVASAANIPDQFILTVKGKQEGRACTVRWRASDKLGISFDVEPVLWTVGAGILLMFTSLMMSMMVLLLPIFEEMRTALISFVAIPSAVVSLLLLLYHFNKQRRTRGNL